MDTCIVLRTALVKDGTMYVQAGGGVVADSVPEAEYQGDHQQIRALFAAAEEAVRFASAAREGPIAKRLFCLTDRGIRKNQLSLWTASGRVGDIFRRMRRRIRSQYS